MTVALTCGEPAGIGPDLAGPVWEALKDAFPVLYIGDPSHLPAGTLWEPATPETAPGVMPRALPVLARDFGAPRRPGTPNPDHAPHVVDAIAEAVSLARSGRVSAICTLPIHKQALIDGANFAYPGHTEFLAALAGTSRAVMMLACPELRVVPATIHIPIAEVPAQFTAALLTDTILIAHAALRRDFGIARPRIAVAGLNPHAGESGKIGLEEQEMMIPTLDALRAEGLDVLGPLSADTMFHPAARSRYDVAVCAYHDQALVPIKTIDFAGGVNVTLGLPFVRTSPDHGTAFDIAGTGKADPTSTLAALRMARDMVRT